MTDRLIWSQDTSTGCRITVRRRQDIRDDPEMNPDPIKKKVLSSQVQDRDAADMRNNKQTQADRGTERERERELHSEPFINEADPVGTKKLFIK